MFKQSRINLFLIFRLLECVCVVFFATFAKSSLYSEETEFMVNRILANYEEVTDVVVNNTIEHVLVFPRTKVSKDTNIAKLKVQFTVGIC